MIKCPYCGKELDLQVMLASAPPAAAKTKWYFSTSCFVIALFCFGPFALPLMWFNPRYKLATKIIVSVLVIAISIWLYREITAAWQLAKQQLGGLQLDY